MRLVSILLAVVLVVQFYNCTTTETDHPDTVIPVERSTITYDVNVDTDSEETIACSPFGRCVPTDQVYYPEGRLNPVDLSRVTVTCDHRWYSNFAYDGMPMADYWVVDVIISNCVEDPLCRDFDTHTYIFQRDHPGFGYCPSRTDPQEMHLLRLFAAIELPSE